MIAALLVLLAVAQLPQPRDARPIPREVASGAVIAGRVVDAQTNAPIPGAVVTVTRLRSTERPESIEADEHGAFRVANLPPGNYRITAGLGAYKATHVSRVFNVEPDADPAKPSIQLLAREERNDIVIRLERALAIEGQVVDEFGLPTADAAVSVERIDRPGGSGQHLSDDRGMFRVHSLRAGTYRVCAAPNSPSDPLIPRGEAGDAVEYPYVRTCSDERVMLKAGATPQVVVAMQRVKGFSVSGRVASESGRKISNLFLESLESFVQSALPATVRDGAFIVRGVPPGDYVIRASAYPVSSGEPFTQAATERAQMMIRVVAADISNLDIVTTKGATVAGRIVPQEPLPARAALSVRRAATYSRVAQIGISPAPLRPDLTFELRNVFDPLLLEVNGLPHGWVITSVRYKRQEIIDTLTTFPTTTDPGELEIVVSPHSAALRVRPLDAEGRVVEGARVMMIRTSGDRLPVGSVLDEEPAADGAVRMVPVRAAEYAVMALRSGEVAPRGNALVELIRRLGTRVLLEPGAFRLIDVAVTTIPEAR